jgi:subtilisin family serine protease
MASPTTAGVAALVLSQHPEMKGADLRALLLSTARLYGDLQVNQPSTTIAPVLVSFDSLSKTGGIADVFAALKKAAGM